MSLMDKFEDKLMPIASVIGQNKYLVALRDGMTLAMPLLIVGSFFTLITNFPITAWTDWLANTTLNGQSLATLLSIPSTVTVSIMAVFIVYGIGMNFAKQEGINPASGGITAIVTWFVLMPFTTSFTPDDSIVALLPEGSVPFSVSSIPLDWVGARGIFIGIICAFISILLYKYISDKGWTIKMPDGVPPTVSQSFSDLIPIALVVIFFLVIRILFVLTPWNDPFTFVYTILQTPLQNIGDSLGAMLLVYLIAHVLWLFGIHGTNVTGAVFNPILLVLSSENQVAVAAGQAPTHIINQQFQDLFATFGGGGSTLSLLIAMFFFCKSKRIKQLGKLAILPGIFGINEPVIFGLPIVLNPTLAIPFILTPLINIIISYVVMLIGLVPITNGVILPWTTPPIISGFLASGWQGSILQILLIILGVFIYLPFIKAIDKEYLLEQGN
ncbi:PTS sugar transporter subunit IIC [uncultured Thomasclavelia sp.]|uniref:PTS sugar transporter subunit IIC n=1 Tax=uncultured Thomasclavelia sp. TaxID=3025759 RepID=UPI0025D175F8|nr:PTS sugar transporter subunit IIC [uncultured Thomasclavelia sp.]